MVWDYKKVKGCLEEISPGITVFSKKIVEELTTRIYDDEVILSAANGVLMFNESWILVVLNRRLLFLCKPIGVDVMVKEYLFEDIKSVSFQNGLKYGDLRFSYEDEILEITMIKEKVAIDILEKMKEFGDIPIVNNLKKVTQEYVWTAKGILDRLFEIDMKEAGKFIRENIELEKLLNSGEKILSATSGINSNKKWLLIATDIRLIATNKAKNSTLELFEINLENIESVDYKKASEDLIIINYGYESTRFTSNNKNEFYDFYNFIIELIGTDKVITNSESHQIFKEDPVEKLKKLKELVELGIITQEEFNNKKEELMKQI